jgi:hypothetical protein
MTQLVARLALALLLLCVPLACAGSQERVDTSRARRTLALFEIELGVIDQLLSASDRLVARDLTIRGVNVVDLADGAVRPNMRVQLSGGRIIAVRPDTLRNGGVGPQEIDGRGKYLMPGLADMHVHQLTSAAQHLLHFATGVTTVRDMVGFPWLLEWRERSARDDWLAPNMRVAGPIIAAVNMGLYAQVVTDEPSARRAVPQTVWPTPYEVS